MERRTWIDKYGAIAIVVALLFILNPELRAFLLVANYIGLDLMILLLAIQCRFLLAQVPALLVQSRPHLCVVGFALLRTATRGLAIALSPSRVTVSLTTYLAFLSSDLQCPTQRRS